MFNYLSKKVPQYKMFNKKRLSIEQQEELEFSFQKYISYIEAISEEAFQAMQQNKLKFPSQEKDKYWIQSDFNFKYIIEERKYKRINFLPYGKLMFFIDKKEIDFKWELLNLYAEELGINQMKVSTLKKNSRASNENVGVIIVYINILFQNDYEAIKKICYNISDFLNYNQKYIYFKTEEQTKKGTRSTGIKKNYLYRFSSEKDLRKKDNIFNFK